MTPPTSIDPGAPGPAKGRSKRSARRVATLLTPALVVALVGALLASAIFERLFVTGTVAVSAAPPPAPPPPPAPASPAVVEVGGSVEREGADGRWSALHAGDALEPDAAIRTGARSWASVAVGPAMRVKLDAETTVRVRRPAGGEHRVTVARGRIDVDAPAAAVRVDTERGGAVARAQDARFSVLATEVGVAVVATRGAVALSSGGAEVQVRAGEGSTVRADEAPSVPQPISAAVLLKVARGARGAEACERIAGRAEPGAEVRVNGELVATTADGSFVAAVRRRRGQPAVLLAVRDASGRRRERTVACADDPEIHDLRMRWGR